jgi:hypothetical protein
MHVTKDADGGGRVLDVCLRKGEDMRPRDGSRRASDISMHGAGC